MKNKIEDKLVIFLEPVSIVYSGIIDDKNIPVNSFELILSSSSSISLITLSSTPLKPLHTIYLSELDGLEVRGLVIYTFVYNDESINIIFIVISVCISNSFNTNDPPCACIFKAVIISPRTNLYASCS